MFHLMYRLDDARREGTLAQAIKKVSNVSDKIAGIMAVQLEGELKAAETKHVFIENFNDPKITDNERIIYKKLLDYFNSLNEKNILLSVTPNEMKYGRMPDLQRRNV